MALGGMCTVRTPAPDFGGPTMTAPLPQRPLLSHRAGAEVVRSFSIDAAGITRRPLAHSVGEPVRCAGDPTVIVNA